MISLVLVSAFTAVMLCQGLVGSGSNQDESAALDVAFYTAILCVVELMVRGVWPYLRCPWVWARLCDPRIDIATKTSLARKLVALRECCADHGFTQRLQSGVVKHGGPELLLPGGRWHGTVKMVSLHRTINVKIEDAFARAACHESSRGQAMCQNQQQS